MRKLGNNKNKEKMEIKTEHEETGNNKENTWK